MIETPKIIELLWKPFIEEVKTGNPVYFCFHSEYLNKIFGQYGAAVSDPCQVIMDAANEFLVVENTDVYVEPEALRPIAQGFSAAIILVAQQILAAEEMVKDETGFSENAYFPRLRAMISPDLPEISMNPFSFDDFERIWRRFAKEIMSIEGSTQASVTFQFGVEEGVNKARYFPLSQALLSREDLLLLTHRIGKEKIAKT